MNQFKHLTTLAMIGAVACTGSHATADLIGIDPGFPSIFYDSQGTLDYDAESNILTIEAEPISIRFQPGDLPVFIDPETDEGVRSVSISIQLDDDGNVVGGVEGPDIVVIGSIDEDNDNVPEFDGVLLSGEITQFGFADVNLINADDDRRESHIDTSSRERRADRVRDLFQSIAGGVLLTTDEFDMRFSPTGGALLSLYGGGDIGVNVTAEGSTFDGDFTVDFSSGAKGNIGPIAVQQLPGACCLPDGSCVVLIEAECDNAGGTFVGSGTLCTPAAVTDPGTWRLGNHPGNDSTPPQYGLRLDELFDVNVGAADFFMFDFEAPGTAMFLTYDGDSIRITGRAFGGLKDGDDFHPDWTSFLTVDITYDVTEPVPGDDDLWVPADAPQSEGFVIWEDTGEVIPIFDYAGENPFTFRFGDTDDDTGHDGYPGISGWGWLNHHDPDVHITATDWQFIALDICPPVEDLPGACCLPDGSCEVVEEDDCLNLGGSFIGEGTLCTPAAVTDPGTWRLGNHPGNDSTPPQYGLRLDELFDVNVGAADFFMFDFEAPGTAMFLTYDGDSIRITGRAFGGLKDGDDFHPDWTSFLTVDITYDVTEPVPGDDDLWVPADAPQSEGFVIWEDTGEVIPIFDYAGENPFTFRFGDTDDDTGHDGYPGISGWGWLNHHDPDVHITATDWQFIALDICPPVEEFPGACCLPDGSCEVLPPAECLAAGGEFVGEGTLCTPDSVTEPGTWSLRNHPDGNEAMPFYGLRLDELFDVTGSTDVFTFDFEHPESEMFLTFDGTSIHIFGTAFGGLDIGGSYHPNWSSVITVDFTYDLAVPVPGDDDLWVPADFTQSSGTIVWEDTGEVIPIYDYPGSFDFSFRFGDEDDDAGHRGHPGISGWGWLNHHDPDVHIPSADWLFTAVSVCE